MYIYLFKKIYPICNKPKYPNIGYKVFTKLENPILLIKIALIQIIKQIILYCFRVFVTSSKNAYPEEIAEVKIADSITTPYMYLYIFPILPATKTNGICISFILDPITNNNRYIIIANMAIIIADIIAIIFI